MGRSVVQACWPGMPRTRDARFRFGACKKKKKTLEQSHMPCQFHSGRPRTLVISCSVGSDHQRRYAGVLLNCPLTRPGGAFIVGDRKGTKETTINIPLVLQVDSNLGAVDSAPAAKVVMASMLRQNCCTKNVISPHVHHKIMPRILPPPQCNYLNDDRQCQDADTRG